MSEGQGFFSRLTPKTSFFAGLLAMLVIFFVIGFFVLLGVVLKDRGENGKIVAAAPGGDVAGAAQPTAPQDITVKEVGESDWARGNSEAKVTLIEYSDLECPFCKNFHESMVQLFKDYANDIRWVFRSFPLTQLHSKAAKEAEAAECAGELGGNEAFWKYIDKVFAVTPANNGLDAAELPKIAKAIGLDEGKFTECLDSGKFTQKIKDAVNEAAAAGAQGTPYTVILSGDKKEPVSGAVPYDQLKSLVDSALKQ